MEPRAETRAQTHAIELPAPPADVFALLHSPSAIRAWWGVARAIVIPERGGTWAAAWGDDEDRPDYATAATIACFEPPARLVLTDMKYAARGGKLPFEADFEVEFTIEPLAAGGARLRVEQRGFPTDPSADDYWAGCERGWRDTLASIARFVAARHGRS